MIKNKTEALIAIELFKSMVKRCTRKEIPYDKDKCLEILLKSNAYLNIEISEYDNVDKKVVSLKFTKGTSSRHLYKGGWYSKTCYGYSDSNSWIDGVRQATSLSELIQLFPTFVEAN